MSKRVPKRRFKGFEGEWEKSKLNEIVTFYNGLTYTPNDIQESGTLVLRSSNVKNGEIIDADNVYVNSGVVNSENVQDGDIIVVVRNGSRDLIGKHAQIKGDKLNTVIGAFMSGIRSKHNKFVNALLDTSAFEREITQNMGATINQITGYMFAQMAFMIPSEDEQDKIGCYFRNIDNLITLHQQKYDKLQALKKAYLHEMFPQEGESVPKRRFAGFSGEWEKSYIENIASFSKGIGYTKNDLQPEGTPIILYGRLYTDYEFEIKNVNSFADKNDFAMISKGNEVIVPASGETAEDIARASAVNVAGCILGGDLNIITPNSEIDSAFLALAMSNGYSSKDLARRAQGKTVVHVHNSDIKEVMVSYPSINEQRKIVNYVRNLDNNIKVINAKLQKLKALKQSYLAEMFV